MALAAGKRKALIVAVKAFLASETAVGMANVSFLSKTLSVFAREWLRRNLPNLRSEHECIDRWSVGEDFPLRRFAYAEEEHRPSIPELIAPGVP